MTMIMAKILLIFHRLNQNPVQKNPKMIINRTNQVFLFYNSVVHNNPAQKNSIKIPKIPKRVKYKKNK